MKPFELVRKAGIFLLIFALVPAITGCENRQPETNRFPRATYSTPSIPKNDVSKKRHTPTPLKTSKRVPSKEASEQTPTLTPTGLPITPPTPPSAPTAAIMTPTDPPSAPTVAIMTPTDPTSAPTVAIMTPTDSTSAPTVTSMTPPIPTSVPTATGALSQPICVLSLTTPVRINQHATLSIRGNAGSTYSITVFYATTASTAKGLEDKVADAFGQVTWTWKVGARVKPGRYRMVVKGDGHEQTFWFEVIH